MAFDCVVIGGGAAGMMAAITAKRNGMDVLIIEHTKRLGSKILQTGNGKCNYSNYMMDESKYLNDNSEFVLSIINRFNVSDTVDFFKSIGVYPKQKNGYLYPHSETAASVNNALRMEIEKLNIKVYLESYVFSIDNNQSGKEKDIDSFFKLELRTPDGNKKISARRIIIATGSKASPKSSSDGSGYELCKKLGIKIKKPLPALTALFTDEADSRISSGVRAFGEVSVYVDKKFVSKSEGEIQYTDYGLSGIPVFQVSRYAVEAFDKKKAVELRVDMLSDISKECLHNYIIDRINTEGHKNIIDFFEGMINKRLSQMLCKRLHIDMTIPVNELSDGAVSGFEKILKDYRTQVTGYKDFDFAQVCQGGVCLEEVDENLQSKKIKGLYFAGEVLDVDGTCGGYNLQWAWSSGYICGGKYE